jgi:hypothetical protein
MITPLRRLYKETLIDPDGIRSSEPLTLGGSSFFSQVAIRGIRRTARFFLPKSAELYGKGGLTASIIGGLCNPPCVLFVDTE